MALLAVGCAWGEVVSLDAGWRLSRGDFELGASWGLKDEGWRVVDVPHDWAIEGPFEETAATGSAGGNVPSGVAWYRRHFVVPMEAKGKRVRLEFDGVMANAEVYVNNGLVAARPNGYVPISVDVTANLAAEGDNLLAVRTDTSRQPASRFYAGAGIYRHVRMVVEEPAHVVRGETTWRTVKVEGDKAVVHVRAVVANEGEKAVKVAVAAVVEKVLGKGVVGESVGFVPMGPQEIAARGRATFEEEVEVKGAEVWDVGRPVLYQGEVRVLKEGLPVEAAGVGGVGGLPSGDVERTTFGIRTAEFRAETGFWLNGKNVKLKGVGLHADMGALGMAVPASAWEARLGALKKLGVNAVRTAHNPASPEFLDVCDRLGLLVMDEVFDAWSVGKTAADYHLNFGEWGERDLAEVIRRDRNHPSVVVYSVGNEIWDLLPQNPDPAPDQFVGPKRTIDLGKAGFLKLREVAHREDPTRPVTMALLRANVMGLYDDGFADLMDVVGQNYRDNELAAAGAKHPSWKILGTEDYKTRETWIALRDNPKLAGQFIWAGADYLGEAGKWPNVASPSGLLDRTNELKGEGLEREAWWADHPVVHVVRMVERAGRPGAGGGKVVRVGVQDWSPVVKGEHEETVAVYSNLGSVELFLNGRSLGTKARDKGDAAREWRVGFEAGTVRAVGKDDQGKEVAEELTTAGAAARVRLVSEKGSVSKGFEDVDYVRAEVVDGAGVRVVSSDAAVTFSVEGPGVVVATDSGALADHESFQGVERKVYRGSCVAIVRATGESGSIVVKAESEGLKRGRVEIRVAKRE